MIDAVFLLQGIAGGAWPDLDPGTIQGHVQPQNYEPYDF